MDTGNLTLDDRFHLLLHKKIMNKRGSAKRRSKKYYKDQYKKTGIIPGPLLLVEKGIMEGRKCSGRPRSVDEQTKKRFVEMIIASCDPSNQGFIFITQKARTIKNYHHWLEKELNRPISLNALRRCVKRENLKLYLNKPDFEDDVSVNYSFKPEPVFSLIQMDGCKFRYFKIRNDNGHWQKPQVIEFYDTGSRHMFTLDAYFSESSLNSVDLFTQFLLSTPFPQKKIRIRPDNAKGFLNLKRAINAMNLKQSIPDGFYMESDFSRIHAPKDKAHLESSHRSLHNFEIRIIKAFENRIKKTIPGYIFSHGKKEKITVGKWITGQVPVERLLGKELILLAWAIEDCDPSVIPAAIKNWLGLSPEERWWLFTMTNASTGGIHDKRGWRKAIRYALTENPVEERNKQGNLLEYLFEKETGKKN